MTPDSFPDKVIEIQIRSLDQHNWATLVEISDLIFDSKLKEYNDKECPELYDFHKLLAKQDHEFTIIEKKRIAEISGKFHYIEKLGTLFMQNYKNLRDERNKLKNKKNSFFLISTDQEGKPELTQFSNFDEAEKAYFDTFINNSNNKNIVLTYFKRTTFNKISVAYSNYFLTYNITLFRVLRIIADLSVHAFNNHKIKEFKRNYKAFWYIVDKWWGDYIMNENKSFLKEKRKINSIKK